MFAVVNHLHFVKPVDEFHAVLQEEGLPLLSGHPGFRDFHFVKTAEDRAIVIILWENGDAAQAGAQSFGPTWFAKHFKPFLAEPEQRSAGNVIVTYKH